MINVYIHGHIVSIELKVCVLSPCVKRLFKCWFVIILKQMCTSPSDLSALFIFRPNEHKAYSVVSMMQRSNYLG